MTEDDAERRLEVENTHAMGLALTLGWTVYAVLLAAAGGPLAGALHLGAALLSLALAHLARKRPERIVAVAHGLTGVTLVAIAAIALFSGQGASQAWLEILLVPLLAATLLDTRRALPWALAAALTVGAIHASSLVVELEPVFVVPAWMRSLGGVVLTALALAYVVHSRSVARRHLRIASARAQTIAAQAAQIAAAGNDVEQARDQAVLTLRHRTEFLATLSHELRAPLNGLLGLSSVLLESKMSPQQTELVQTLHQSATSMRKILNDVLDLSRIEAGRLQLRDESVDLRELVGEVLDVFAPSAADRNVELAAIVGPDVHETVLVDPVRFGQVLTNLVGNALKFTREGEIVVELAQLSEERSGARVLSAHASEAERRAGRQTGDRIRMTVRDTGPGIPTEERARLFQPYEQTASGLGSREIGSGLGLWIAQRIVHAMGGTIGIGDVPTGSLFFVEWDARRGDPLVRDSVEIRVGLHVLAVEDHEASGRALRSIAESLGFDVTVARTIGEAREAVTGMQELHAVLIDVTLPGLSPGTAAEALRAIPELRGLPLVSAVAPSAALMRDGVEGPFVASTLKPYRASRVLALLNDVLAPRPAMPTPVSMSPWRPLDVLVVDDDSTNRLVAELLLQRAGLRSVPAVSGEDALARIGSQRFDVVFLDLHMSGIDGLETARRIRAEHDPGGRLWIVALTASVYEEDRQRCLEAGMDDFVPKPIEIGLFRAALERAQRAVRRRGSTSGSFARPIAQAAAVSPAALTELARALGTEEVILLVDDYVQSSTALTEQLREAVERADGETATRAAHTLASSSGQLGATEVESLARSIEHAAHAGMLPPVHEVQRLSRAHEAAVQRLLERVQELTR